MDDQSTACEAKAAPKKTSVFSRLLTLLREPLYTSALYLWISAASVGLGGLAYWSLTARLYEPDDVGRASAALSVLIFVGMFSHLGLGLGLIRFLPESPDEGPRLVNVVFTASAAFAMVASAVFLVGLPWWAPSLGFLRENPLHTIAIVLFAFSAVLITVQTHVFLAIRRAEYILAQTILLVLVRVVVVILMASFFGAFGIVAAWGLATVLAMLMGFALLVGSFTGYRPRAIVDLPAMRMMAPFSAGNHFADSVLSAPGLLMPLLVVTLVGSEEAAYFF
ncbi:MAG: lipopolysaccharide biosynthesis protein, partial [Dehalococcoidia bacterium]